jgi:glycosyltransferase involved in cell wall biosynthesis
MPASIVSEAPPPVRVSIIFPCYNEAENIAGVIADAREHLKTIRAEYELIIVDDGSTDATADRARAATGDDSRIRVVEHSTNLGYGHALRSGFRAARLPLVCYVDADGQFSLADLSRLIEAKGSHGFVLGYRIHRADPAHRTLNARLWQTFVRLVLGFNVRDLDCGFKLFRRELIQAPNLMAGRGAVISAELIAKLTREGHTYAEVGVQHYPRTAGEQSGNSLRVVFSSFVDILRLRWQLR